MGGEQQITVAYLRDRVAHYRELAAKADDHRAAERYQQLSELLEAEADSCERHPLTPTVGELNRADQ